MKIAHRGASALLGLVLSVLSLGCAREGSALDARAPRQPPLESPLRSILGTRQTLAAPAPRERLFALHATAPSPQVHVVRHERR